MPVIVEERAGGSDFGGRRRRERVNYRPHRPRRSRTLVGELPTLGIFFFLIFSYEVIAEVSCFCPFADSSSASAMHVCRRVRRCRLWRVRSLHRPAAWRCAGAGFGAAGRRQLRQWDPLSNDETAGSPVGLDWVWLPAGTGHATTGGLQLVQAVQLQCSGQGVQGFIGSCHLPLWRRPWTGGFVAESAPSTWLLAPPRGRFRGACLLTAGTFELYSCRLGSKSSATRPGSRRIRDVNWVSPSRVKQSRWELGRLRRFMPDPAMLRPMVQRESNGRWP